VGNGARFRKLLVATLGAAALLFGGCDWTMFGYDAGHTGSSADTTINSANAATLKTLFTVPAQIGSDGISSSQFGPPVESNGVVYAGSANPEGAGGTLEAFDANGAADCSGSPNQCSPLWTASTGLIDPQTAPAVVNGVVYIVSSTESVSSPVPPTLYAFDANGATNCSGTPKVCQPLWTASLDTGGSCCAIAEPPNVTNGMVYVSTYQTPGPPPGGPSGSVEAFDANGVTNCSGTPKVCQPLWITSSDVGYSPPAVANGVLYAIGEDTLDAFSANGTTGCSGTPKVCQPLWSATLDASPTFISTASPSVSGGIVYAQSANFNLEAFDANGVTNCSGTPATCTPLWTATDTGLDGVANGIVFGLTNADGALSAFDAKGVTNCAGTPKTCTPLWSYSLAEPVGPVSVANGLVFYGSSACAAACDTDPGFTFAAFDANGVTKCSGAPKVCQPMWSTLTTNPEEGAAAIANGKIYVGESLSVGVDKTSPSRLDAWVLPPPTTTIIKPSNGSTVSGSQGLDALASAGVTQVQYELTGGSFNHSVIATGTATIYGWTSTWNTTTVPNGAYTLQSVASYGGEVSGTSAPLTLHVSN
jgi:hypothetical protein